MPPPQKPQLEEKAYKQEKPLPQYPFQVGEKLTYLASWSLFSVGTIDSEIMPLVSVNDELSYHIKGVAKTNEFFSAIYNAQEDFETFFNARDFRPYKFELQARETKWTRQHITAFDYESGEVYYWKKSVHVENPQKIKTKEASYKIKTKLFDALTPIYYMRTLPLKINTKAVFKVVENAEILQISCEILKEENIKIMEVNQPAFYFECQLKKIESKGKIKENQKDSNFLGWVAKNSPHELLKTQAEAKIGSISIELIKKQ